MHQVLQRTRPAPPPSSQTVPPLLNLLRSFFTSKRGLGLIALVVGTTLGSQALHGLLVPNSGPSAPPAGADGRQQSNASAEPALQPPPPPVVPRAAAKSPATRQADADATAGIGRAPGDASGSAAVPVRPYRHRPPEPSPAPLVRRWERPSHSRQGAIAGPIAGSRVIAASSPQARPGSLSAAAHSVPPGRRAQAANDAPAVGDPRNTISLSALDPFLGLPCSDTLSALPSDRPAEEAWLPAGTGSSSVLQAAALETTLEPPLDSGSPDRAAGPPLPSLQATRNTPCLLKQPAGRN